MRKFTILMVSLALAGAACGKSDKKDAVAPATTAGLRAALLTAAEMPSGYKRTSVTMDKPDSSTIGCTQLDNVDKQYLNTTVHTADASYANGASANVTQIVDETIYTFKTAAAAKTYFDAEQAGFNACKTFDAMEEDGTTHDTGTLDTYAFPTVADASFAVSATFNSTSGGETTSLAGPFVLVRKGNAFLGMIFFHIGNQPGLAGSDIESIVRKAADKI